MIVSCATAWLQRLTMVQTNRIRVWTVKTYFIGWVYKRIRLLSLVLELNEIYVKHYSWLHTIKDIGGTRNLYSQLFSYILYHDTSNSRVVCWIFVHAFIYNITCFGREGLGVVNDSFGWMNNSIRTLTQTHLWPWTTKPVLSVNFSKLRCIHDLKAEEISFPLVCGLLGS